MKPYYQDAAVTIYHGDCREVAADLCARCGSGLSRDSRDGSICEGCADSPTACRCARVSVLTDPPWGNSTQCNAQRFTRATSPWWKNVDTSKIVAHENIANDDKPFDPQPWIGYPAIIWGANHFSSRLRDSGGWLIWDKRIGAEGMAEKGWPLGEAELAWTNVIGATRVFRNLWSGLLRSDEKGEFYHPTQKPLALMKWCLQFLPEGVVLDPFMGSGTTLRAAKDLGRKAIGIEIEERYCAIAAKRCAQEILPLEDGVVRTTAPCRAADACCTDATIGPACVMDLK